MQPLQLENSSIKPHVSLCKVIAFISTVWSVACRFGDSDLVVGGSGRMLLIGWWQQEAERVDRRFPHLHFLWYFNKHRSRHLKLYTYTHTAVSRCRLHLWSCFWYSITNPLCWLQIYSDRGVWRPWRLRPRENTPRRLWRPIAWPNNDGPTNRHSLGRHNPKFSSAQPSNPHIRSARPRTRPSCRSDRTEDILWTRCRNCWTSYWGCVRHKTHVTVPLSSSRELIMMCNIWPDSADGQRLQRQQRQQRHAVQTPETETKNLFVVV